MRLTGREWQQRGNLCPSSAVATTAGFRVANRHFSREDLRRLSLRHRSVRIRRENHVHARARVPRVPKKPKPLPLTRARRRRACLGTGRPPHTRAMAGSPVRRLRKTGARDPTTGEVVVTPRLPPVAGASKPPGRRPAGSGSPLALSAQRRRGRSPLPRTWDEMSSGKGCEGCRQ